MIGPEQLAAGQRAETAGDYVAASAAYVAVANVPDAPVAMQAHFCLGRVSWRQGRFDAALKSFENARALAVRLEDVDMCARIDNGIGAVHYARGDYVSARRAYGEALTRTTDPAMRGKVILNLGVIENIQGNFEVAREHYERAYHLFTESDDSDSAMLALHNRGMVEADLRLWDEADESFLASFQLATAAGNREMIAKSLVNRSEVLIERGNLREAVDHCQRALDIYAVVGDEVGRGEALRWNALALGRIGDQVAAERLAAEALQIAMRSGSRLLEAESARDLGVLRGLLGDRAGSVKLLRRALAVFTELGAKRDAADVAALLQRPTPARSLERIDYER